MASLLESTICSLRMGRGVCGCATNTVLGCGAGGLYTTGVRNSAIGNEAGRATSGVDKVSLGCRTGLLSFSSRNVFAGTLIGSSNYYGTDNVAVGQNNNYFGTYRTVSVGTQVFRAGNATNAVALGRLSFCASVGCVVGIGVNAGRTANGDNHIVAIGESAGQYSSGAGSNTIGACAGRFGGNPNTTQIGFYAYGGNYAPNRFVIGKYGFSCSQVYVAWSNVSDARDKTNVTNLPNNLGLNFIRKLRPVSFKFDYRKEYMYKCGFEYGDKDGTLKRNEINYGFLAQEIKNASDELNVTFDGVTYDYLDDSYGLKTYELLSPIVKAIQEINQELDLIEQQIN
jgi:hypothetical protein